MYGTATEAALEYDRLLQKHATEERLAWGSGRAAVGGPYRPDLRVQGNLGIKITVIFCNG